MTKDNFAELYGMMVSSIKQAHKKGRPVEKTRALFLLSIKTH